MAIRRLQPLKPGQLDIHDTSGKTVEMMNLVSIVDLQSMLISCTTGVQRCGTAMGSAGQI